MVTAISPLWARLGSTGAAIASVTNTVTRWGVSTRSPAAITLVGVRSAERVARNMISPLCRNSASWGLMLASVSATGGFPMGRWRGRQSVEDTPGVAWGAGGFAAGAPSRGVRDPLRVPR